jgi:WD40 repeat protein
MEHQARISAAVFSPDGETMLTGSWDRTARLWNAATGKPTSPPLSHTGPIWAVAYSPDNRIVATASDDQTARLWDSRTGKPLGPPLKHESVVRTIAFGPDGHMVLTGSWDGTARIWNVPAPVEGTAAQIVLQTELLTGMELDENAARALDAQAWSARQREALAGSREK